MPLSDHVAVVAVPPLSGAAVVVVVVAVRVVQAGIDFDCPSEWFFHDGRDILDPLEWFFHDGHDILAVFAVLSVHEELAHCVVTE